jgi:hypothetical protein
MVTDDYRAYLLRLWRADNDGRHWRARLENVETGEAQGFGSLAKLIEFLHSLGEDAPQGKETSEGMISD